MSTKLQRKQKLQRALYGATVLAFLGFAVWFVFGERGVLRANRLRHTLLAQRAQEQEFRVLYDSLNAYLEALREGDPLAMERAAREHGLVGPNERIIEVQIDTTK